MFASGKKETTNTPTKSSPSQLDVHCNLIKCALIPLLNLPNNIFKYIGSNYSTYKVNKATLINPPDKNDEQLHFVKEVNPTKNPKNFMPQLEATASNYYDLIMDRPEAIALTTAHYVANQRSGLIYDTVSSKEIPFFKPASEDPLKEENFHIEFYKANPTLKTMLQLDAQDIICRNTKEYKDYRTQLKKGMHLNLKKTMISGLPLEDMLNYQMIKGQAIGLTSSYILQEDDTTRNNISKFGERVDLDMSLWPFFCFYKERPGGVQNYLLGFFDSATRSGDAKRFAFTAKNILHFPDLPEADPYYFPTKLRLPAQYGHSMNAFTAAENELYKKLATHPVFIFHKYKTLLKFVLTDPEMYKQLALLHSDENTTLPHPTHSHACMADVLKEHMAARITELRGVLVNMDDFNKFMNTQGEAALALILREWGERNDRFQKLQTDIDQQYNTSPDKPARSILISLKDVRTRFDALKNQLAKYHGQHILKHTTASLSFYEDYDSKAQPASETKPAIPSQTM